MKPETKIRKLQRENKVLYYLIDQLVGTLCHLAIAGDRALEEDTRAQLEAFVELVQTDATFACKEYGPCPVCREEL